jgi:hypothetical protein
MVKNLLRSQPFARIENEQVLNQIFGLVTHIIEVGCFEAPIALSDRLKFCFLAPFKGQFSGKRVVQDDAEAPAVNCRAIGLFL